MPSSATRTRRCFGRCCHCVLGTFTYSPTYTRAHLLITFIWLEVYIKRCHKYITIILYTALASFDQLFTTYPQLILHARPHTCLAQPAWRRDLETCTDVATRPHHPAIVCSFDCASLTEMETMLALGVEPKDIIFANPCKVTRVTFVLKKRPLNHLVEIEVHGNG